VRTHISEEVAEEVAETVVVASMVEEEEEDEEEKIPSSSQECVGIVIKLVTRQQSAERRSEMKEVAKYLQLQHQRLCQHLQLLLSKLHSQEHLNKCLQQRQHPHKLYTHTRSGCSRCGAA
jgi:DNA replication protein DnaD